jgi:hypothetical protein
MDVIRLTRLNNRRLGGLSGRSRLAAVSVSGALGAPPSQLRKGCQGFSGRTTRMHALGEDTR